jgi:hypothetical protein
MLIQRMTKVYPLRQAVFGVRCQSCMGKGFHDIGGYKHLYLKCKDCHGTGMAGIQATSKLMQVCTHNGHVVGYFDV